MSTTIDTDLTTRILMSLVNDLATAQESMARIAVQIEALARQHGVAMVVPMSAA